MKQWHTPLAADLEGHQYVPPKINLMVETHKIVNLEADIKTERNILHTFW